MAEGFASIIAQLEKQQSAIQRALAALREVEGIEPREVEEEGRAKEVTSTLQSTAGTIQEPCASVTSLPSTA